MRVEVHVHGSFPMLLGGHWIPAEANAGIGKEEIDRPERLLGGLDQVNVAGLGTDVSDHLNRARELIFDYCETVAIR